MSTIILWRADPDGEEYAEEIPFEGTIGQARAYAQSIINKGATDDLGNTAIAFDIE